MGLDYACGRMSFRQDRAARVGWMIALGCCMPGFCALACKAEQEHAPLLVPDPNLAGEHPLCTARAAAYHADAGCLGAKQFFGEGVAFGTHCPVVDASVCIQVAPDAGLQLGHDTWVLSGEHYGIPDGRKLVRCDPETASAVISAPKCSEE
jgi:hypothetical protein